MTQLALLSRWARADHSLFAYRSTEAHESIQVIESSVSGFDQTTRSLPHKVWSVPLWMLGSSVGSVSRRTSSKSSAQGIDGNNWQVVVARWIATLRNAGP